MTTTTFVASPNQLITEDKFLGMKVRLIDFQFDASYPTGGEVLTAASIGWVTVLGAIPLHCKNAAGSLWAPVWCVPNAANTQLNIFLGNENDAGAYAQRVKIAEAQGTSDQSLFTARLLVFGA